MSSVTSRAYDVAFKLAPHPMEYVYRVSSSERHLLTVTDIELHFSVGRILTNGNSHNWYVNLRGSYPLHVPEPVCACSPDKLKRRQGASQRVGGHTRYPVPEWAMTFVDAHAPAWINL